MPLAFVLVHSPSVGPLTWAPVAQRLRDRGHDGVVPSLLHVADAGPPFWPRVVNDVRRATNRLPEARPVVLVAHSNAGLFVPLLATRSPRPVATCLFVDAALPAPTGSTPTAPQELLEVLRPLATGGRLPRWTEWWDEDDVAPMFPDAETRRAITDEQPRLPFAYYEQTVPVPSGWDDRPCGYLLFGPPYEDAAADAEGRGWLVEQLPGEHLHQVVDPDGVANRLVDMVQRLSPP